MNIDLNSSIIINKCFYLTNSTLLINLEGKHYNKTIISFDPSCSNTSNFNYSFYNTPTDFCPSLEVESNSISILFVNCNEMKKGEDNSTTWVIILIVVLGSVIVIAVSFLLVVFLVPSIKNKVFPNSDKMNQNRVKNKEKIHNQL